MIESKNPINNVETVEKLGDPYEIQKGLRRNKLTEAKPRIDSFKETDFAIRHEKVKDRVLSLLREDKYARQDDFYLCLLYWVKCGMIKMEVDFKDFQNITKPESISRCRRELFSLAKTDPKLKFLLNDEETLEIRELEQENYTDYYKK